VKDLVVGTSGHIDHGKSALVLALTGIDPDRLKEEKARGITIELGFAHAVVDDTMCAFVDVPGHERFVRAMLAGAGGIDCVMLIVAADEGVMPQTREHFDICRLLGVKAGLVVMTKADLADEATREVVKLEIAELVAGSFLASAPIVETSARTGEGLDDLRRALSDAASRAATRPRGGAPRLPIDRVFSMRGFGTVVTGTLVSGTIPIGEELVVLPSGRLVKVRGLQVHGQPAQEVHAGQRAAVNLGGVEVSEVSRGETLAAARSLGVTRRADVELELLPGARPLRHGARVRVHQGTAELLARVSIAGAGTNEILPGDKVLARLRLESPGVLTRGDRVILRAYSPPQTVGAATVLDPAPLAAGVRSAAGLARLEALHTLDAAGALVVMVEQQGVKGLVASDATVRAGVPQDEVAATLDRLEERGLVVRAGHRLVTPKAVEGAATQLTTLLEQSHRHEPLSEGVPREEARARLGGLDRDIFEAVIAALVRRGALVDGERLAVAGHRVELVGEDARALAAVEQFYRDAGLTTPDAASVGAGTGVPRATIATVTTLLVRKKVLVKLDTLIVHRDALDRLKRDMAALKAEQPGPVRLDVATFKERYAMSRKFAIPLLEYLDRERVTRRVGDARVLI
jgi:selenocysteine-specific elongation factor